MLVADNEDQAYTGGSIASKITFATFDTVTESLTKLKQQKDWFGKATTL